MFNRRSFILSTGALLAAPSISFASKRQVTRMVIGEMRCGKSAYGAETTARRLSDGVSVALIGADCRHAIQMASHVNTWNDGTFPRSWCSPNFRSETPYAPQKFVWIDENAPDNLIEWALANCEEVVWTTCPNSQAARYLDRFQYKRYMEIKTNWQV